MKKIKIPTIAATLLLLVGSFACAEELSPVAAIGTNRWQVQMDWVTNACARLTGSRDGRSYVFQHLSPVTNNTGATVGVGLVISETNTILQALGFASGNVIRKVNCAAMTDPNGAIRLLNELKDRKMDVIVVELDTAMGIQTNVYFLEPDHSIQRGKDMEKCLRTMPANRSTTTPH